jgi:hypothetical protein
MDIRGFFALRPGQNPRGLFIRPPPRREYENKAENKAQTRLFDYGIYVLLPLFGFMAGGRFLRAPKTARGALGRVAWPAAQKRLRSAPGTVPEFPKCVCGGRVTGTATRENAVETGRFLHKTHCSPFGNHCTILLNFCYCGGAGFVLTFKYKQCIQRKMVILTKGVSLKSGGLRICSHSLKRSDSE